MNHYKDLQGEEEVLNKELRRVRGDIEDYESKQLLPQLRAQYVGMCFKSRNSYSCPEEPEDYWWCYQKVISIDGVYDFNILQFQTDKYGKMSIDEMSGYESYLGESISHDEFQSAFSDFKKEIERKGL